MSTIFAVRNEHLARLSPLEAVDFFRELLWAEATALEVGKNLISVPSAITVADGGIDAEVRNVTISGGQGIIKPGLNRYQIKTGSFSLSNRSDIKSILLKEDSDELKPKIKTCLDNNGVLVVVLFGWDNPEPQDNQLINKFKEELININQNYNNPRIEIWRQNNLISFLKPFPSLAFKLNGLGGLNFQTHESWSRDAEMQKEFKKGQAQAGFISKLQNELRKNDRPVHIRIYGEPGIGKTRLVLEATRDEDVRPLIIYCDNAGKFRDTDLMNEILRDDNQFTAIVVIDECNLDSRLYIWNKLQYYSPRIKLISIYNDDVDTSGNTTPLYVPLLEEPQVSDIILSYAIPKDQADRWVGYCNGSPRAAHIFGQNLHNNPDDLLMSPDTANVWDRWIVGSDDPKGQEVQQRRLVLYHIALFKKFGYEKPVIAEAKFIAQMIQQSNTSITWGRFQEIVNSLRRRKILQGENTLYITPKLLHIYLWTQWWDTYGSDVNPVEFSKQLPSTLCTWFHEMFKYATGSSIARKIVGELLDPSTPFQEND